jgi:hypothetical protein
MGLNGATEASWGLYQQSRAAIDASLDEVAAAETYAMAQTLLPKSAGAVSTRRKIIDDPLNAEAFIMAEINKKIEGLPGSGRP